MPLKQKKQNAVMTQQQRHDAECRKWLDNYIKEFAPDKVGDEDNPTYDDIVYLASSSFDGAAWADDAYKSRDERTIITNDEADPDEFLDCARSELNGVLDEFRFPFNEMEENDNDLYENIAYGVAVEMSKQAYPGLYYGS